MPRTAYGVLHLARQSIQNWTSFSNPSQEVVSQRIYWPTGINDDARRLGGSLEQTAIGEDGQQQTIWLRRARTTDRNAVGV